MLFSSLVFLCAFLPVVLITYYVLTEKWRNYFLLSASLIFYAWGGVSYTVLLIASILLNYGIAKKINLTKSVLWLRIGLCFNIGVLLVFKYLDFFIENLNGLIQITPITHTIPYSNIILPLGISFFTFQQMSLLWDIYREESSQKISFINTALYISFFPQLIAGPIVRYHDIISQIKSRTESITLFNSGVQKFILGLFKKVIIANQMALLADNIFSEPQEMLTSVAAWLGIIAYTLQIYFDFSGYSDMAIGLGRMFGFKIFENFNFPYTSTTIQEFWRRWHISLSSWFKDYVYIPLGGNRLGSSRTYINLILVFLCTGFWHGATWSFVFWGAFHGLFLIIEKLGFANILNKLPKVIQWLYTMLVVIIGWVFFRIEVFSEALSYVTLLFSFKTNAPLYALKFLNRENLFVLILGIISSSYILKRWVNLFFSLKSDRIISLSLFVKNVFLLIILLYVIIDLNSGSYNPFIYFRF